MLSCPRVLSWATVWLGFGSVRVAPLNNYIFSLDNIKSLNNVQPLKTPHVLKVKYFAQVFALERNAHSATWKLTIIAGS